MYMHIYTQSNYNRKLGRLAKSPHLFSNHMSPHHKIQICSVIKWCCNNHNGRKEAP